MKKLRLPKDLRKRQSRKKAISANEKGLIMISGPVDGPETEEQKRFRVKESIRAKAWDEEFFAELDKRGFEVINRRDPSEWMPVLYRLIMGGHSIIFRKDIGLWFVQGTNRMQAFYEGDKKTKVNLAGAMSAKRLVGYLEKRGKKWKLGKRGLKYYAKKAELIKRIKAWCKKNDYKVSEIDNKHMELTTGDCSLWDNHAGARVEFSYRSGWRKLHVGDFNQKWTEESTLPESKLITIAELDQKLASMFTMVNLIAMAKLAGVQDHEGFLKWKEEIGSAKRLNPTEVSELECALELE